MLENVGESYSICAIIIFLFFTFKYGNKYAKNKYLKIFFSVGFYKFEYGVMIEIVGIVYINFVFATMLQFYDVAIENII